MRPNVGRNIFNCCGRVRAAAENACGRRGWSLDWESETNTGRLLAEITRDPGAYKYKVCGRIFSSKVELLSTDIICNNHLFDTIRILETLFFKLLGDFLYHLRLLGGLLGRVAPASEYRAPHPDISAPHPNCLLEVLGHPHAQLDVRLLHLQGSGDLGATVPELCEVRIHSLNIRLSDKPERRQLLNPSVNTSALAAMLLPRSPMVISPQNLRLLQLVTICLTASTTLAGSMPFLFSSPDVFT